MGEREIEPDLSAFAVLNPGGRDATRLFPHGAGSPADPGHPPVNYHAYAACCRGGYYRRVGEIPGTVRAVLVLLRRNGLDAALRTVRALSARGIGVWISWKESGLHQVADALADPRRYERFCAVCRAADGFLSSTPELPSIYEAAGCSEGAWIPTPYPVGEAGWDFSRPLAERRGVFIGTREFNVPSRNHLLAVGAACRMGHPVTVINTDGTRGARLLRAICPAIRIVEGRHPYAAYLRLMAEHRIVFQLDASSVPGQVAGDALLCGMPCVGGNGAVDRVAFGPPGDVAHAISHAAHLLDDDDLWLREVAASQRAATAQLSFAAVAERLHSLIDPGFTGAGT